VFQSKIPEGRRILISRKPTRKIKPSAKEKLVGTLENGFCNNDLTYWWDSVFDPFLNELNSSHQIGYPRGKRF